VKVKNKKMEWIIFLKNNAGACPIDLFMGGFGLRHCRKLQAELGALMRARSCTVLTVCLMGPCKGDTELQETPNMRLQLRSPFLPVLLCYSGSFVAKLK
jgi:hypothetical protein